MRNSEGSVLVKYELIVTKKQKKRFKQVLRAKMADKGIRTSDLAKMTGYSPHSIYNFMAVNSWNRFMAVALAEKLGISEEEWR